MAKHQHYVPRKYLRAWATNEKIWCDRGSGAFNSNIMGVAQERYFYRLERLTSEDFALAYAIIVDRLTYEPLKRECEATLNTYRAMYETEHIIADPAYSKLLDDFLLTIDDDIITAIEQEVFPFLDSANGGDLSFLEDLEKSSKFYHGLMLQYFRTHKIRANFLTDMPEILAQRIAKIWPLFRTLYSMITSFHIVARGDEFKAKLIHSGEDCRFITSDQPIINLAAIASETPSKAVFYYPLSPQNALVLSDCDETEYICHPGSTEINADLLNQEIARGRHTQIYSHEKSLIDKYNKT